MRVNILAQLIVIISSNFISDVGSVILMIQKNRVNHIDLEYTRAQNGRSAYDLNRFMLTSF